jgi:hypothetical protein
MCLPHVGGQAQQFRHGLGLLCRRGLLAQQPDALLLLTLAL